MTSAFSWQNSVSLCSALFCTPKPNLHVSPGVSWLPTFAFQSPIMKGHLFWVLVLEGLVGLHRTVQLQLLQHYWSGHRLGLLWYWMVCLGNKQRSFCLFWDCIQVLHFGLFCWHSFWGVPARSSGYKGHLPWAWGSSSRLRLCAVSATCACAPIPRIHTANYNRLNYRNDMHSRASCYIICNCQSRTLPIMQITLP